MTRPLCSHCGKPYGRRDTHHVTLRWAGEPKATYGGYLEVVKQSAVRTTLDNRLACDVEVWNGRDWRGGYSPFCTLRCALDYARKAFRKAEAR